MFLVATTYRLFAMTKPVPIPPQVVNGKIEWVYRYEEGKRIAHESGKPMFVVFRCER
jgi:hypothetical protein